jgi:hypothetical protein
MNVTGHAIRDGPGGSTNRLAITVVLVAAAVVG